jgi:hypothetical protein
MTILYALISAYWAFLYYQHRHDILPVQNYITAILVFLVIEMLMTWGYFGTSRTKRDLDISMVWQRTDA